MSACQFDFQLPVGPDRLLPALRDDFARFGGTISGSGEGGSASGFGEFLLPTPLGEFAGTYEILDSGAGGCSVRIEIETKPMFVPCAAIEQHLGRRLARAAEAV